MNIFRALTSGSNYCKIKEESFSSFLAYLLNPSEDHGLSSIFLSKFLKELGLENKYKELPRVDVKTEQFTSKRKRLDLRLLFSDSSNDNKPDFEIIIENKVNDNTALGNDLEHYFSDSETEDTFLVLLTPPNWRGVGLEKFNQLNTENKKHIKWGSSREDDISVAKIITDILKEESVGDLSPLPSDLIHYLKSLKDFIINFMSLDLEAKQSIDDGKIIQMKEVEVNGKHYQISMHENSSIRVRDIGAGHEVVAKPILREVIRSYVPEELHSKMLDDPPNGRQINTRTMGKYLLEWLNKRANS